MQPRFAFVLTATLLVPALAAAQDNPPPARVGNVWNGVAHQPTRSDVREGEKAAGLRGPPGQEQQRANDVEELNRQVLQRAQQGTNDGVLDGSAAAKPSP